MINLIEKITNAYESSTLNNNLFKKVIESVKWDKTFFADCEYYFIKGTITFTTPSLNPFEITKTWRPSFLTSDGSIIEL